MRLHGATNKGGPVQQWAGLAMASCHWQWLLGWPAAVQHFFSFTSRALRTQPFHFVRLVQRYCVEKMPTMVGGYSAEKDADDAIKTLVESVKSSVAEVSILIWQIKNEGNSVVQLEA